MKKTVSKAALVGTIQEASEVFKLCTRKTKILASLAWKPEVASEFFQKKASTLPKPTYSIDRKMYLEVLEALKTLSAKLKGEHPVLQWLSRTEQSFSNGVRLLLEIEKDSFFEVSTELYGNATSRLFNGSTSNLELSDAIGGRMSVCSLNDIAESVVLKSSDEFASALEAKLRSRQPEIPVKAEVTDQIVAKVAAGMNRVRIRKDARFADIELASLWNHEIESHCLTAHNGARQEVADFLTAGGPRTTMTQEGLAVFYEIYGHTMSQGRFLTLCDRIQAVHLVTEGADFIELYRWYRDRCDNDLEAFYSAQRIFRGAKLTGRAPFTKDVVYLVGLLGIYNFLRIAVKNQNRLLVETLVCGRLSLEDVGTIAWLRTHGVIRPPYFIPDWLQNWEALLSFFSLTAVLGSLDLSGFQQYFDSYYTLEDWDLSL